MENKYKVSKYTEFFSLDDRLFLLFNCFSRSIVRLKKDDFQKLESLKGKEFKENEFDKDIFDKLLEENIVVTSKTAELKKVLEKFNTLREKGDRLSLTIATTMDCNFACPYCYEINNPKYMTDEIEDKIFKFVEEKGKDKKKISVVWIGGEPLMAKERIFSLCENINKMANENKVETYHSLVTNGYFLNKEVTDRLISLGFKSIQITIDGPEEVHNKRRFLKFKKGETFEKIFKNLKYCAGKIEHLTVRMNVDETNKDKWKDLKDLLKKEGIYKHINFSLGAVDAVNDHNIKTNNSCLTTDNFAEIKSDYQFNTIDDENSKMYLPSMSACTAISKNSYSIDPMGFLYKCWNHIGMENEAVGHIKDFDNLNEKNKEWLDFNIEDYKMCKKCKVLPICVGNCPDKLKKFGPGKLVCSTHKKNLRETVLLYYLSEKKEMLERYEL